MDFIKSRWSTGSTISNSNNNNNDHDDNNNNTTNANEAQTNQSQSIETSYNSVTFTNAHSHNQNPIIISTQHPGQISIIHEVRKPKLKATTMTSPTESFHSVQSSYPGGHDKRDGKVNMSYNNASNVNLTNHQQQNQTQNQSQLPQYHVFHQSYWSWNWPWQDWNVREKAFLLVIVILSLCVLSLTSALSVVIQKNVEYRDMLFQHINNET